MSTPLTDSINALTRYANETTGATDTTLSDAVESLVAGYNDSIKIESGVLTISESTDEIVVNHNLGGIPEFAYICVDVSEGSLIPLGSCFFAAYGFINIMNMQNVSNNKRFAYVYRYRHSTSGNILGDRSDMFDSKYSDKIFTFTRGVANWSPIDANGDTMHYKWMVGRFTR